MSIEVAQPIFDAIDNAAKTQMNNISKVMSVMGGVIGIFWMIYIGIKAFYWYFEGLTVVVQDVLMTIFKASCVMFMAFSVSWYISVIIPTVTDFPVWLGNTISGNSDNNMNLVDGLLNSYVDGIKKLVTAIKFDTSAFIVIISLLLYLLGGVPFLGVAVGTLITLKAATTLIMVVGPIFIAMALFPQTKHYFWGWVGVLGGFVLTQALFVVVLALEISFINSNIVIENVNLDLLGCLGILLSFGAFTMLATEIPNYAAAIMGGAPSGGVSGVGGIAGKALGINAATRMAQGAVKKLKRGNRIS